MQERGFADLVARHELPVLGPTFDYAWPVEEEAPSFNELLRAIEDAERQERDQSAAEGGRR